MTKEVNLNRNLYKLELFVLKLIPMLLALVCVLNTLLSYFDIDLVILSYIGGISLFPIIFLYIASYMFKFCSYHRVFLHYIVVTWIINLYDYYVGIDCSDAENLCIQMSVLGIFLFILLYAHIKHTKKGSSTNNK